MNLCSTCACSHRRVPAIRSHRLMPLKEYNEAKFADPASVTAPRQCDKHPSHPLAYFCETCDEVICLECTVIDHRAPEHKNQYLKESAKNYVKDLQTLLTKLAEKERDVNESKYHIDERIASLEKRYNEEKSKLNVHIEGILQKVRRVGALFEEKMKSEYESRKKTLQWQIKELQRTENDLSSTRDYIKNIFDFASAAQLMTAKKGITSQAQELMKTKTKVKPKESDYIEFRKTDDLIGVEPGDVGDVFGLSTCSTVAKVSKYGGSKVALSIVLQADDHQGTPLFTSTDEVQGTITGCGDREQQMPVKSIKSKSIHLESQCLKLDRDCKLRVVVHGTQISPFTKRNQNSEEPMRFHQHHGGRVKFSSGYNTATPEGSSAIIFTHRSITFDEKISVNMSSYSYGSEQHAQCFSMETNDAIGLTRKNPDEMSQSYLQNLRPHDLHNSTNYWLIPAKCFGSNFRLWVSKGGKMLCSSNNDDARVCFHDIDLSKPLWFVFVLQNAIKKINLFN
ncbi:E3 ubiquitin-protein ligase TRIM71-like [Ptychodera flava]|uniref:E3 ubiquitin-protein ligase TRIM71-like n=1 Tax=Ptychodera flava TaxID=63121 RepID=UPI00396AAA0A